jgi:hypothetical protein
MWDPFKRRHLVPVDECINAVIDAMKRDRLVSANLWDWLESRGVKHVWKNSTMSNYLVFDSEHDYTMFLLKL